MSVAPNWSVTIVSRPSAAYFSSYSFGAPSNGSVRSDVLEEGLLDNAADAALAGLANAAAFWAVVKGRSCACATAQVSKPARMRGRQTEK